MAGGGGVAAVGVRGHVVCRLSGVCQNVCKTRLGQDYM